MLKDSVVAFVLRVGGTALWLVLTVVLARSLSQADFGSVMYVINLLLVLTPIAALGLPTSALRHGSVYWSRREVDRLSGLTRQSVLYATAGSALTVCALLFVWQIRLLPEALPAPLVYWAVPGLVLSALLAVNQNIIRGMGRIVAALVGFTVIRPLLPLLICAGYALVSGPDAVVAFACIVLGLAAGLLHQFVTLVRAGVRLRGPSQLGKGYIRVALGAWPSEVASGLLVRIGGVVVGSMLGVKQAALYLAADRIAALAQFLLDAIRVACAPHIARAAHGEGEMSLQNVVSDVSLLMFLSGLAGCSGVVIVGYPALLLLGEQYVSAYPIILLLVAGYLSWGICGPVGIILTMSGHERLNSLVSILSSAAALLMSWLAAGRLGIYGVAAVFALVSWISNAVLAVIVWRATGIRTGQLGIDRAAVRRLRAKGIVALAGLGANGSRQDSA